MCIITSPHPRSFPPSVRRLVCVGVLSDVWVASSLATAVDLGYECTILSDACLAASPDVLERASKIAARVATVCTTTEWLSQRQDAMDASGRARAPPSSPV